MQFFLRKPFWMIAVSFTVMGSLETSGFEPAVLPTPRVLTTYSIEEVSQGSEASQSPPNVSRVVRVGDGIRLQLKESVVGAVGIEPLAEGAESGEFYFNPADVKLQNQKMQFIVEPLKEGQLTLPSLVLKNPDGQPIGRTQPFAISVGSAISANDPKPQEPAPPAPPVGLPFPGWVVAVLLIGLGGCIVLLGWLGVKLVQRFKIRRPLTAPAIQEPEDVIALRSLVELTRLQWLEKGLMKPYYFGISEILKLYFGKRYGFDALECTSGELIRTFDQKSILTSEMLDELGQLFRILDRVKFTDFTPSSEEPGWILEKAQGWVHRTRRVQSVSKVTGVNHALS